MYRSLFNYSTQGALSLWPDITRHMRIGPIIILSLDRLSYFDFISDITGVQRSYLSIIKRHTIPAVNISSILLWSLSSVLSLLQRVIESELELFLLNLSVFFDSLRIINWFKITLLSFFLMLYCTPCTIWKIATRFLLKRHIPVVMTAWLGFPADRQLFCLWDKHREFLASNILFQFINVRVFFKTTIHARLFTKSLRLLQTNSI